MKNILFLITLCFTALLSIGQSVEQTDTLYQTITVQQADTLIQAHSSDTNFVIIDLRTVSEINSNGYIEGAINMNYYGSTFSSDLDVLDHNKIYLIYCQSGARSGQTFTMMQNKHFVTVYNMQGGMNSWVGAGLPVVFTTGISSFNISDKTFYLYPNPVTDISVIDITTLKISNASIYIYDAVGNLVKYFETNNENKFFIDHSEFENGIYFIQIVSDKRTENTGKLIVSH